MREKRLLCTMGLFHFLHDDSVEINEFFELGVACGNDDMSEDFLLHFRTVTDGVHDLDVGTVAVKRLKRVDLSDKINQSPA